MFNIGEASRASGVHAKMIRHYETVGLLPKARRTDSGYRVYDESDVNTLKFVRRARDLGFAIDDIKTLLGLWRNKRRASRDVKALVAAHVERLEAKITELHAMRDTLLHLAKNCHGNDRPDCPILGELESADSGCCPKPKKTKKKVNE